MRKLLNLFNRNLTKIIWVLAILAWVGVGVYYLSTNKLTNIQKETKVTLSLPTPRVTFTPKTSEIQKIEGIIKNQEGNTWTLTIAEKEVLLQVNEATAYNFFNGSSLLSVKKEDVKLNDEVIAIGVLSNQRLLAQEIRVKKR